MDGDSTIDDLPGFDEGAGKGSIALDIRTGAFYILGSEGWDTLISSGSGSEIEQYE